MSLTRLVVLMMSATALTISGCGSGSATTATTTSGGGGSGPTGGAPSSSTTNATPNATVANGRTSTVLSRPELIANANAICKRVHGQLRGFKGQKLDLEQVYTRATAFERSALIELQKLRPPAELAGDWRQIVASVEMLAKDSASYVELVKAKNTKAEKSLAASYAPIKQQAKLLALHDGLVECASAF